jgi:hypothetical protein
MLISVIVKEDFRPAASAVSLGRFAVVWQLDSVAFSHLPPSELNQMVPVGGKALMVA